MLKFALSGSFSIPNHSVFFLLPDVQSGKRSYFQTLIDPLPDLDLQTLNTCKFQTSLIQKLSPDLSGWLSSSGLQISRSRVHLLKSFLKCISFHDDYLSLQSKSMLDVRSLAHYTWNISVLFLLSVFRALVFFLFFSFF